jgi:4-amino-4-deoxy-L-arabinose transferase-like glycosyltransferase
MPLSRQRLLLVVLLAAAICPYFMDLDGSSIWDANEAFYVETPREMILRGDYISPSFNFEPRLNKPVLSYWMVAAFYKAFGVSVGVERLAIALGAIVMILTACFLARAAFDSRTALAQAGAAGSSISSIDAALWAGVGLAIAPRLLMFSRRIFIDIYISMFMGLTLLFFALAERFPERRRTFLLLMYAAAGLGVLTKGPIAVAIPGLVFGAYLIVHGELRRIREMLLPAGVLLIALIVVPWYAALHQRYGWTYITSFIRGENIARYTEGVGVQSSRGALFYLPVLFSDSFPWSIFLPAAAVRWLSERRAAATAPEPERLAFRVRTLLWLWVLAIVVFFSFSAGKQDLYIFPIVPAIATLAGVFIAQALGAFDPREALAQARSTRPGRDFYGTVVTLGMLLGVAGAGTIYVFQSAGKVYALDGAAFVGYAGAIGGLVVLLLGLMKRPTAALMAVIVTLVILNWSFVLRVLPSFERYKPVPFISDVIRQRASANDAVVHYNVALPSMVYYLERHIDVLFESRPFLEMLRQPRTVFAVLSASDYETLAPLMGVPTCVLDRRPTVNVKLKAVLAREPLPQVLLITNRCP